MEPESFGSASRVQRVNRSPVILDGSSEGVWLVAPVVKIYRADPDR